jgi:hypothetical protein
LAGNRFERSGQAFGAGLAEQLPQEIGRYRLRKGLEELGQPGQKPMTPFQQAAKLASIPGITPENMGPFIELLRRQNAIREAQGGEQVQEGIGTQAMPKEPIVGAVSEIAQRTESPDYLFSPSPEQVYSEAVELQRQKPNLYPEVADAQAFLQKRYNDRLVRDQQIETRLNSIDERINEATNEILQKKNVYSDVPGEIVKKIRNKYLNNPAVNPRKAGNEAAREILDFGKTRLNLKTAAEPFNTIMHPKETFERISSAKKEYEKHDALEIFKDDLQSNFGLSDKTANYIAKPIESNQKLNSYIKGLNPKSTVTYSKPESFFERPEATKTPAKSLNEIVKEVSNLITDDDSLQSIAIALDERLYNGNEFLNLVRDDPKFRKNKEQERELQQPYNVLPNLGDIMFLAVSWAKKRRKL